MRTDNVQQFIYRGINLFQRCCTNQEPTLPRQGDKVKTKLDGDTHYLVVISIVFEYMVDGSMTISIYLGD